MDRLDPNKPYTFDNIELVTFKENMRRHGEVVKCDKGNPVLCANKHTGQIVGEFISQNEAAKILKIDQKKIGEKVDKVLLYGWLATIGDYQIVSKKHENKYIKNGWLKEEYRYKPKNRYC